MPINAVKNLVVLAAVLTAAGCLQLPDTGTASYGYGPHSRQAPSFAAYSPSAYSPVPYNPSPIYAPPAYQPPPLSPNLTRETVPIPAVGYAPQVRYAPPPSPPSPPASLLGPAPTPSTSLFGPQRPGWN